VTETVSLGLLDPSLRLKAVRSAVVTVQVVPAPLERTLRNRPVHLRNLAATLEAQAVPAAVDLTMRGSRDALNRFDPDDIGAFVDLAGLGPGQYSLTVHVDASSEVGITGVHPTSVQVRIISGKD
jgi:YbbR domain-containing protein